jgi:hypothetical protein
MFLAVVLINSCIGKDEEPGEEEDVKLTEVESRWANNVARITVVERKEKKRKDRKDRKEEEIVKGQKMNENLPPPTTDHHHLHRTFFSQWCNGDSPFSCAVKFQSMPISHVKNTLNK